MGLQLLQTSNLVAGVSAALAGGVPVAPDPGEKLRPALRLGVPVTEPDAALVVATSGSTGQPKAVVLSAAALRFAAAASHERLGGPGDWVSALPAAHVAGVMTVVRAVHAGRGVRFTRPDLSDLPAVTTRSYLSLVAAQLDPALGDPNLVGRLREYATILVGGGRLDPALQQRARDAGLPIVTSYGMSETCGGCVYDGRPLGGVGVELDGERIILSGPMLFSGYRGDPAATARALPDGRLWTSDRGRWVASRLQVLGRLDQVVVSGGVNIDLDWVQQICDTAFGAGVIAVLAVPHPRWGQQVVGLTTSDTPPSELRDRLKPLLGPAATPARLRWTPALPLTALGKYDRTGLIRLWREGAADGDAR